MGVTRKVQKCVKVDSRVFKWSFKWIKRMFQGSFKVF